MAEKEPEFVVTDRRKYRMDGDDVTANPEQSPEPESKPAQPAAEAAQPAQTAEGSAEAPADEQQESFDEGDLPPAPPPPTAEETEASERAYRQTTDRLDDIARANDLAGRREGPVNFERLVQSFYTSALVQLGMVGAPGQQQIRVDIVGARQTIDLLGVIKDKAAGNLTPDEQKLMDSALFELRIAFLETMQLLAAQAQKQQSPAAPGGNVTPFSTGAPPKR